MLYTDGYEDFKPIFFASIDCDIHNAAADFNRAGLDDADYVDDEVFVKIRHRFRQFPRVDRINDTIYCIDNNSICLFYFRCVCLQQND